MSLGNLVSRVLVPPIGERPGCPHTLDGYPLLEPGRITNLRLPEVSGDTKPRLDLKKSTRTLTGLGSHDDTSP